MRFIETDGGDYLALDTIAKITNVKTVRDKNNVHNTTVHLTVITKRGEILDAVMGERAFYEMVEGK